MISTGGGMKEVKQEVPLSFPVSADSLVIISVSSNLKVEEAVEGKLRSATVAEMGRCCTNVIVRSSSVSETLPRPL
jgi:hypothetical protein